MSLNKVETLIQIPFASEEEAEIAYHVLRVEKEPKRSHVEKELSVEGKVLSAKFSADSTRHIRVAVNGFYDNVLLINETIEFTGPPVSARYEHDV